MNLPLPLLDGGHRDAHGLRVIVTGASGTFGRAICTRLTGLGARVVGLDVAPREDDPVEVIACDLTDDDRVPAAVAEAVGRLAPTCPVTIATGPAEALDVARGLTPADGLIVVTGSLFLAAETRARLLGLIAEPTRPLAAP